MWRRRRGRMPTGTVCAVLVGGANGNLDLVESIDGRSCKLQCRLACCTRHAEYCVGEGL